MRAHRRIPPTPLEVLQLMPPPLEVLRWNHDQVRVMLLGNTTMQEVEASSAAWGGSAVTAFPWAVPWWCMWPKCNIVQSPPWKAFQTGVTVRGQEEQSEWVSGDQLCVQTPTVHPSCWISARDFAGLTLSLWV